VVIVTGILYPHIKFIHFNTKYNKFKSKKQIAADMDTGMDSADNLNAAADLFDDWV